MTAPTYESTTLTDFTSDVTAHAANMPATVNAGDLLLALVGVDSTATIGTPSGWTLLGTFTTVNPTFSVYGKVADGTEDSTTVDWATLTNEQASVHVIRITAWAGSLNSVLLAMRGGGQSDQLQLRIGASADVLWVAAQAKSTSSTWGSTPTNYINETKSDVAQDTTTGASVVSATRALTASEESIPGWWLTGSAVLIAVLPVAAVGSGGGSGVSVLGGVNLR